MSDARENPVVKGHVKWFDVIRGYGFVVTEDKGDVLLHAKVLRASGYPAIVSPDSIIECFAEQTNRGGGFRAIHVVSIDSHSAQDARVQQVAEALKISAEDLSYALGHCGYRLDRVQ